MRRLPLRPNSRQRFSAKLLAAVMLYQLGACPCGCIEHNAWVQLLGFDSGDDALGAATGSNGASSVSSADLHDCTGKPRMPFVDNARPPRPQRSLAPDAPPSQLAGQVASPGSLDGLGAESIAAYVIPAFDAAPDRPALQVYRL